jgi:hypothetical protein
MVSNKENASVLSDRQSRDAICLPEF